MAVIGIAGPIDDNTVRMANVMKWGLIDGRVLSEKLKIPLFKLANDFEAASYGVLLLSPEEIVSLNGLECDWKKIRGVMGPGTGLVNSTLYPLAVSGRKITCVLPSEGGHTDFPTID